MFVELRNPYISIPPKRPLHYSLLYVTKKKKVGLGLAWPPSGLPHYRVGEGGGWGCRDLKGVFKCLFEVLFPRERDQGVGTPVL